MKRQYMMLYIMAALAFLLVFVAVAVIDNKFMRASSQLWHENNITIVVDAGHGGFDGGAVSKDGVVEKDINLAIALKVEKLLKMAGYNVIMTRETDVAIYDEDLPAGESKKVSDIHNRLKIVEEDENRVLLSIHQNKFEVEKYSGTQVFYGPKNEESAKFAQTMQSTVVSLLQPDNTREIKKSTNDIYILYNAENPAILVECGFLSNEAEAEKLQTEEYQSQMAFAIMCGVIEHFGADGLQ